MRKKFDLELVKSTRRLSPHFTIDEFERSEVAKSLKLDNRVPDDKLEALFRLCNDVLEPLREHMNKPIKILSGYRCMFLNDVVSREPLSQHMRGQAADFVVIGEDVDSVFDFILENCLFDQVINEGSWIHISWKSIGNRRQALYKIKTGVYRGVKL